MDNDRRRFLVLVGLAPLAAIAIGAGVASAQPAAVCVDPAALPLMQKNRRRGLGYTEAAPDPKKRCRGCAFFITGKGNCGTCQLLSGGAVSATAVCNSFAPRLG